MSDTNTPAPAAVKSAIGSLFAMFENNKDLETNGVLVRYGDVRFRIARAGGTNQKFKNVLKHLSAPLRRQIDNDSLSDEAGDDLMARVYARSVVLGWETLRRDDEGEPVLDEKKVEVWDPIAHDRQGNPLAFTEDNVVFLLKQLPDLFADIRMMAGKQANFRREEEEADKGNS